MRLIDIFLQDEFTHCDACGHDIKWRYVILNGDRRMTVGSECVNALLGPVAEHLDRRAKRAAAQWRKQEPAPRPNETRERYINRRMVEMTNARRAYNAYAAFWATGKLDSYARKVNDRARRLFNTGLDMRDSFYDRPFSRTTIRDRVISRLERRYNANRYDFDGRKPWDVVKI